MVNFEKARELFRDVVDLTQYIPLPTSEKTKNDLLFAINQKEKMILLSGNAGSGKSLLLRSVYEEEEKCVANGVLLKELCLLMDRILTTHLSRSDICHLIDFIFTG